MAGVYSELAKRGISQYDKISVKWNNNEITGILMPRYHKTSEDVVVIKLSSGYNIGISVSPNDITLLEKNKAKHDESKSTIPKKKSKCHALSVFLCGGTIASKVEYETGAVHPVKHVEALSDMIPEMLELPYLNFVELMPTFSEDMTPKHWEIIAREVYKHIRKGAKGIVILHGTDTMHYTSAALSFALQDLPVPVILVGAQRSSDRPSSDSHLNFLNAVFSANQDIAEVLICMHGTISDDFAHLHRGTRVRKMHTSRRDAFKSIGIPPVAEVDFRKNIFRPLIKYRRRGNTMPKLRDKFNGNVGMLYTYPGMKPEIIRSYSNYDGLVIVGTGLGHVSANPLGGKYARPILNEIKDLISSGIPVVMASQTIYGRINLNVYTTGRLLKEVGVIGDHADWTPEVAYVKLCHVLAYEKNMKRIKDAMMRDISGEITDCSILDSTP